jgi:hypothetical protein
LSQILVAICWNPTAPVNRHLRAASRSTFLKPAAAFDGFLLEYRAYQHVVCINIIIDIYFSIYSHEFYYQMFFTGWFQTSSISQYGVVQRGCDSISLKFTRRDLG